MARAALNWSLADLAARAGVHRNTVSNFETGKFAGTEDAISAMRTALESAGVEFIAENGGGAGVRLKKPAQTPVEIEKKISELDAKAKALDVDRAPSPRKAMNQLKKAVVENEKTKLTKGKRRQSKEPS
ncbi:multiprotein-bridging factor 1 family protein [Methylocella sp.]|uniref:multiprotein-bridging factor 1 family protein n=1 Tax=Methylocella sp. TaxID=1978226 RepID=UPI00378329DA